MEIQGILPAQVELQGAQDLPVHEVVHFFEHRDADECAYRDVWPSVIRVVEGAEGFFVDEGKNLISERPGPSPVKGCEELGGKVDIGIEEGFLRALGFKQFNASLRI
jgi:hypothetical protein